MLYSIVTSGLVWLTLSFFGVASHQCLQTTLLHPPLCSLAGNDDNPSDNTSTARSTTRTPDRPVLNSPNENFSWEQPFVCTQHLDHLEGALCIYTSRTFSSNRGITVLTRPVTADRILQLVRLAESDLVANRPTYNWREEALPGRGVGVLATKSLDLGDRITAYTPALISMRNVGIGAVDLESLLDRAVNQLPQSTRERVLKLARSMPGELSQFKIQGMHMAVFPETARINHSCAPK